MKVGDLDLDTTVMVVAEIGNNHEGDLGVAREMIVRAAEAGADAVKFQTFIPELYVSSSDPVRLERLRGFRLAIQQFEELARQAADENVVFLSTPFDLESAVSLNRFQSVFKIASGDNTFGPLIDTVAGFGKPMIVSTGIADLPLIERLCERVRGVWLSNDVSPGLALLHCVAGYPVPPEQANLGAILTLKTRFPEATIGYSDHTLGIDAAIYAVAAGARIVEKHFTLDKERASFRDHRLAADPADFRRLVNAIRQIESMLGAGNKDIQPCEEAVRTAARRSIGAVTELKAGTILTKSHLTWLRPGLGMPPGEEGRVIGRTLVRSLKQGDLIALTDVT